MLQPNMTPIITYPEPEIAKKAFDDLFFKISLYEMMTTIDAMENWLPYIENRRKERVEIIKKKFRLDDSELTEITNDIHELYNDQTLIYWFKDCLSLFDIYEKNPDALNLESSMDIIIEENAKREYSAKPGDHIGFIYLSDNYFYYLRKEFGLN